MFGLKDEKTVKEVLQMSVFQLLYCKDLDKVLNFFFSGIKRITAFSKSMGKTAFLFLLKDSCGNSSHGQMIHTELFLYEVSPIFTT